MFVHVAKQANGRPMSQHLKSFYAMNVSQESFTLLQGNPEFIYKEVKLFRLVKCERTPARERRGFHALSILHINPPLGSFSITCQNSPIQLSSTQLTILY
jgi:hypothetical protein